MSDEPQQLDPGLNAADAVNVDAVRAKRKSMTRGPVAVTLLFLAGVAGLIGIGGFWSYPVYQETMQLHEDASNRAAEIQKKEVDLVEVQKRNREAEERPSPEVQALASRVPPTFEVPQTIRDLVALMVLDPSNPEARIAMKSFSFEVPKATTTPATLNVSLSYSASAVRLQEFLDTVSLVREDAAGRRIATPTSINISYKSGLTNAGVPTGDTAARFAYLLRQAQYHLISEEEQRELDDAKKTRVTDLMNAIEKRDALQYELRGLESQHFEGGVELLVHNDELARVRRELKAQNDAVSALSKEADVATKEVTGSLKLELYAETGGAPAKDAKSVAPKTPPTK